MSDESEDAAPVLRGEGGKFLPGTRGGPGRQRRRPLRDVVTFEKEATLWEAQYTQATAENDPEARPAREFLLRHVAGNPYQSAPEVPAIAWPEVLTLADLGSAVNAMLGAHREGQIDGAGLAFLTDIVLKLSKVYETLDLGPQVRQLQEQLAEIKAASKAAG